MKKLIALLMSIVMVSVLLFGCSAGNTTAGESAEEPIRIAFVISDLSNEVWMEMLEACAQKADELGAEFTFKEAQEVEQKIVEIENLTNADYDVIISHVSDPDAMQPVISAAQEKGIKFFAFDTDTETSDAFFGNDEVTLGTKIGTNAAEWINANFSADETVKVGLANYPEFNFLVYREQGIRDALAELAPNAEIVVAQQAGFVPEGVEVGEVWVQSVPDLDVVVGINDSGILGIYQAFVAAGVDPMDENIGFFGCDGSNEALKLIDEKGIYRGTVKIDLVSAGAAFIENAVALVNGEDIQHDNYFNALPVNQDNIGEYYTAK